MLQILFAGLILTVTLPTFASNWQRLKTQKSGGCMASYTAGMREIKRVDKTHVQVSTSRPADSQIAVLELNSSSSKDSLPTDGGNLDIFVEKTKTVNGTDNWRECAVDPRELTK